MAVRKATPARSRTTIPVLVWNQARPAPVVLVSGSESFLADRVLRMLRDQLKAQDPALEVSDILANDYAPGECSPSPAHRCSANRG